MYVRLFSPRFDVSADTVVGVALPAAAEEGVWAELVDAL